MLFEFVQYHDLVLNSRLLLIEPLRPIGLLLLLLLLRCPAQVVVDGRKRSAFDEYLMNCLHLFAGRKSRWRRTEQPIVTPRGLCWRHTYGRSYIATLVCFTRTNRRLHVPCFYVHNLQLKCVLETVVVVNYARKQCKSKQTMLAQERIVVVWTVQQIGHNNMVDL